MPTSQGPQASGRAGASAPVDEEATFRTVARRLIPFLFLCYVAAYLDRVNVGFAKLQMQADLKFSDTVYGMGAGILLRLTVQAKQAQAQL